MRSRVYAHGASMHGPRLLLPASTELAPCPASDEGQIQVTLRQAGGDSDRSLVRAFSDRPHGGSVLELLQQAEKIKLHPVIDDSAARHGVDDNQTSGDGPAGWFHAGKRTTLDAAKFAPHPGGYGHIPSRSE